MGIASPGGMAASARRVVIYRGLAVIIGVLGFVLGEPGRDQLIAIAISFLFLAELATVARAVEETALQGERSEDRSGLGVTSTKALD